MKSTYKIDFQDDDIMQGKSSLTEFLAEIKSYVDKKGIDNQLSNDSLLEHYRTIALEENVNRPFLSIITRTQGMRADTLREVFLCLAGQSCDDFEVLVMGHQLSLEKKVIVESVVKDTPSWLQEKIRLIKVDHGNHITLLNEGFRQAQGRYIAILDDDDIVLGHWVETFKTLEEKYPARVLRAVSVRQDYEKVETKFSSRSVRSVSKISTEYPRQFDFLQHLYQNQSPRLCLAFPRLAFHNLGIEFDESLVATEDWDFLMRVVFICGIGCSEEITSIYRRWRESECRFKQLSAEEWQLNKEKIYEKFNSSYILLPPGSAEQIKKLIKNSKPDTISLSVKLTNLLLLKSWRLTTLIRMLRRLINR